MHIIESLHRLNFLRQGIAAQGDTYMTFASSFKIVFEPELVCSVYEHSVKIS